MCSEPDRQKDPLFILVYTLLYPALLGSFIFAILEMPPNFKGMIASDVHPPWAPLFALYFVAQHVQATKEGGRIGMKAFFDFAEMGAMILLFYGLGYFREQGAPFDINGLTAIAMIAVLAIPIIARFAVKRTIRSVLTLLSVASVLTIIFTFFIVLISELFAFWIVFLILLFYLYGWVFTNKYA